MSQPPDIHGPLDQEEVAALREHFGYKVFESKLGTVAAYSNPGFRRPIYISTKQRVAPESILASFEDVGISADRVYEELRKIRAKRRN